jgi:hypothetical protein
MMRGVGGGRKTSARSPLIACLSLCLCNGLSHVSPCDNNGNKRVTNCMVYRRMNEQLLPPPPSPARSIYLELENLVTAFVPSLMACLESSPGRMRRTEVWISRDEMVDFLL